MISKSSDDLIGKKICDALGLKHVKRLDIHMGVNEITTVKVEMSADIEGLKQFPAILKKFQLVPVPEGTTILSQKFDEHSKEIDNSDPDRVVGYPGFDMMWGR